SCAYAWPPPSWLLPAVEFASAWPFRFDIPSSFCLRTQSVTHSSVTDTSQRAEAAQRCDTRFVARMTPGIVSPPHEILSPEEWRKLGRARRKVVSRSSHAEWDPPADRPDPVDILREQAEQRVSDIVGIRHSRMVASQFPYFRGAAAPMAWDLAHTPTTDIRVQACGDAHLLNFGLFAAPDRLLVFDVNDFDETLPASFEWDVKRLAASV